MRREIAAFDKKTEVLNFYIKITIPDEILFEYFKEYVKDDPLLIYEYEISKKDSLFFKKHMSIDFDFDKNDYFLSCSES